LLDTQGGINTQKEGKEAIKERGVEEREAVVVEKRRYSPMGRRLITCQYITIRDIRERL
jgi:hypothetical protein